MIDDVAVARVALKGQAGLTRINVAQVGSGPPLLLLHGWCNNWVGWTPLAAELAPDFRLIMPDLPGFGDSDPLPAYTLDAVAPLLQCLLDALGVCPAGIVGASLGALVAADLLARAPQLTRRLVLIGPIFSAAAGRVRLVERLLGPWRHRPVAQRAVAAIIRSRSHAYFMEYFFNTRTFRPALIERYGMPGRRKVTGRAYVQFGLDALAFDLDRFVASAPLPTLLLRGVADSHVSGAQIDAFAAGNPCVFAAHVPGAGHNIGYEAPAAAAAIIRRFFGDLAA